MNTPPDDVPSFLVVLILGLYFLPTILVYYIQRSAGHPVGWRRRMVLLAFLTNFLMGWSIIGWFWALKFARVRPEDMVARAPAPVPVGGPAGPGSLPAPAAERPPCNACGGQRTLTCMGCGGQGGRWRAPQTANDVAR